MDISFVVPALNEKLTIKQLIADLDRSFPEVPILVVDNGSHDGTAEAAAARGAQVISESRRGKGWALRRGIEACETSLCFTVDADLIGFGQSHLDRARSALTDSVAVARLSWDRIPADAPVTYLLARPLLASCSQWAPVEPLGGMQLIRRDSFLRFHLPGGWGVDVAMCLSALTESSYAEVSSTGLKHRRKPLADYSGMSREVATAILEGVGLLPWTHEDCVLCAQTVPRLDAAERP